MNNTPVMTFLWIVLTLSVRPLYAQDNSESALDMSHTGLSQSITDVMHTGFLAEPLTPGNPKEKVLLDSMTRHTFVSSDSTWLPDVHYTYTYDEYGKVLTRTYRTWDKQMDAWKNSSRFTYQ